MIHRVLNRLTRVNYGLAKRYYFHTLRQADRRYDKPPLLVYQMGKVGSSSIVNSLQGAKLGRSIYHVHFLTSDLVKKYEQKRKKWLRTKKVNDLKHIWQYEHIRKRLNEVSEKKKWKVITLVRDPVARNLATFFEHIELLSESDSAWRLRSLEYEFDTTVAKDNLQPLVDLFFEKCRHDAPLVYFDREFKSVLDVDLYAHDFDLAKGYQVYDNDLLDILVMRLEDLNKNSCEAMKEFLDLDDFVLKSKNVGSQKDYANVYERFKDVIYLPESYLDRLYSSNFVKHFYSENEIQQFRARWSVKSRPSCVTKEAPPASVVG